MKIIVQIALWIVCIVFGYMIYGSVTGPIEFKKVKQERFAKVVSTLKDIKNSQEAYKTVTGRYAKNFNSLITFIDTANYTITQQRDSSFLRFNKTYGIDLQIDTVIIDVLGMVSIKDSLFKKDNRFKSMMNIPGAQNGEKFDLKATIIDKNGYRAPVYEVKAEKNTVLYDQPKDLLAKENAELGVDVVNGTAITVGSLEEVSTSGNWPPIYDSKNDL